MFAAETPVTVKSLKVVVEVIATVPKLTEDSVVCRCVHVFIYKIVLIVVQLCGTLIKHLPSYWSSPCHWH